MVRSLFLCVLPAACAIDNGLGLSPPLGWRSWNAFGGVIDQATMTTMMDAMVDRSRTVAGKPTSLLDLGYNHVGLDGGWNFCFPENKTFHWESDGRPVWNDGFPDPSAMVAKAHQLGLSPGWYLNNCGCAENAFEGDMVDKVMRGSVRMLYEQEWDGVKLDSCSQFHNLTRWAELINATGRPMLIENCHQGAYTPGMRQWQGYQKVANGSYSHFLGMFFGMQTATVLPNTTFADCRAHCDGLQAGCGGFAFESAEVPHTTASAPPLATRPGAPPPPRPRLRQCYAMGATPTPNHMDMSNSNQCTGAAAPSDCPFNLYRVSGDISPSFGSVLANMERALPFLGQGHGNVHLPYPQGPTVRSLPGGFAYPDMLVRRRRAFSGDCVAVAVTVTVTLRLAVCNGPLASVHLLPPPPPSHAPHPGSRQPRQRHRRPHAL
jgi:alpha-galactosidase